MPELGVLSSKYESAGNPGAIAFDGPGGWSYGSYQIATKVGTFAAFLKFCHADFPDTAVILEAAGGNAGATAGTDIFKACWTALAKEHRDDFARVQHEFIVATHYGLAIHMLVISGYDLSKRSHTVAEVLFSLAVAAGPGSTRPSKSGLRLGCAGEVCDAILAVGRPLVEIDDHILIDAVYSEKLKRIDTGKEYATQTAQIKASVRKRFVKEQIDAETMLGEELAGKTLIKS